MSIWSVRKVARSERSSADASAAVRAPNWTHTTTEERRGPRVPMASVKASGVPGESAALAQLRKLLPRSKAKRTTSGGMAKPVEEARRSRQTGLPNARAPRVRKGWIATRIDLLIRVDTTRACFLG